MLRREHRRNRSPKITGTTNPQELFARAATLLRTGDAAGAAQACKLALDAYPTDANLLCLDARANLALRHFDIARRRVESALESFPEFALAHDTFGDLLLVENEPGAALAAYARALELDPRLTQTRQKIAKARELVRAAAAFPVADSRRHTRRHTGGQTGRTVAYAADLATAEKHRREGDKDKAEAIYRRILKSDPEHVEAARLLAGIASEHERYREAEVFLKRATELAPDYARAWVDLANVQRHLDKFDEAVISAKRVIELVPDTAESHMVYASAIGAAGHHEDAIDAFARVLELDPAKRGALCAMAHHQKTVGRQDDAVDSYRRCIALEPGHGEAWWSLANLKTFRFRDDEVDTMLELLRDPALAGESRLQIHNALGFAFERRKDYDRAFENFAACNGIRRVEESYDPVETETTHDRVIDRFDPAFLAQAPGEPVRPVPIFVVGLPRSGSTLIEQILASHKLVEGTHELTDLSRVARELRRRTRGDQTFPAVVSALNAAGWSRLGREYMGRTEQHRRGGAPFFVDKNPNNFVFAGLIRLALPNAKIVNARRHPLDSCLGTYKQLFASGQPFSYDLVELGEYYLQYQRLMDHWHRVMPGFVLDVHYERVVKDLEGEVRRLLDFCGLPFDDACLRFHETARAVKTASSEQVRQPIYSGSVNLWRNYEGHLGDLVDVLEPLLAELPETDRPHTMADA